MKVRPGGWLLLRVVLVVVDRGLLSLWAARRCECDKCPSDMKFVGAVEPEAKEELVLVE